MNDLFAIVTFTIFCVLIFTIPIGLEIKSRKELDRNMHVDG